MEAPAEASRTLQDRRRGALDRLRGGPLAGFIGQAAPFEIGGPADELPAEGSQEVVVSAYRLQDISDYRGALQSWFRAVGRGGRLIVIVPHAFLYERQLALPSRWNPNQRRLYTPRSLMDEVEEALEPNSYRLRWLGDDDEGYDYGQEGEVEPSGGSDILLVLEKIAQPAWRLGQHHANPQRVRGVGPDFAFEPARTRVEFAAARTARKVLILKLDHLGDFIMAIPALEKARAVFAGSELTLVVGSWNVGMARDLGLADRVLSFDAFPRNSTEDEPYVSGKVSEFRSAVTEEYDLAIDLRTDFDTRELLKHVRAPLKAGLGTRARFPFLDIFLPLDGTRNEPETARVDELSHRNFAAQRHVVCGEYRLSSAKDEVERHCAIVWGPYSRHRPGQYIFEPFLELGPADGGLLRLDVALDTRRVAELIVPSAERPRLHFSIEDPESEFEFRIWAVEGAPAIDFSFFGGRLIRAGAASVLHQSEYQSLLIELVSMRLNRTGVLGPAVGPA